MAVLTLLAIDGVLSAVAAAFFLQVRVGSVPFPISALIAGVVNATLVWAALQWTSAPRLAGLPLWTWLLTVAVMMLGGIGRAGPAPAAPDEPATYQALGDDIVFGGAGVMEFAPLLLIALGTLPPAAVLWRHVNA